MRSRFTVLILSTCLVLSVGCSKNEPPAAATVVTKKQVPLVPRPDAPPRSAFGAIQSADRGPTTSALTLCSKGRCKVTATAAEGRTFVVIHFDGPATADVNSSTFTSLDAKGPKYLMEQKARLEDDAGMFYSEGFLVTERGQRSIAYEIPVDSASLTWYDGKKYFQLEPYPAERKR